MKTLVPRVIGQTAEAQKKVSPRAGKTWDEPSFLQDLEMRRGPADVQVARRLLDWARARGLRSWWGKGAKDGSFFPLLDHGGDTHWLISAWTFGRIEVQFQWLKAKPPFSDEAKRLDLLQRLNAIPGVNLPPDAITRRPSVSLAVLADDAALKMLLAVLDWVIGEVRTASL